MAFLKREHVELLIGIGVLALGLGLLVFTFSHALAIATAPGDFFRGQMPQQTPTGPSASFTWDTNGANTTTVQDTSRQGDVAITSWNWNFGDGTRLSGQNPGSHTYANASVYQVSLIVRDSNGKESRAVAQVEAVPMQPRSGDSLGDPTAGLQLSFDFGGILQPVAITFLTFRGVLPSETTSAIETDSFTASTSGERTPVMINRTRRIPLYFRSTRTPKMTFASGRIAAVSPSTTSCAVRSGRPGPALMWMRAPFAPR